MLLFACCTTKEQDVQTGVDSINFDFYNDTTSTIGIYDYYITKDSGTFTRPLKYIIRNDTTIHLDTIYK